MRWFWILCLTMAAVSDIKERMVSCRVLFVCGIFGIIYGISTGVSSHIQGLSVGLAIVFMSKVTRGAIGLGDGWFFIASAWYLNTKEMWTLLLISLSVGWIWSIGLILRGIRYGRNTNNSTVPFLACMWPAGMWILIQEEGRVWLSSLTLN